MLFHYGEVDRIARGQMRMRQYKLLGVLHYFFIHGKDFIHNAVQCVESLLNETVPPDGRKSVQDLLQNFGIANQPLLLNEEFCNQSLRVKFVNMIHADQVHGDIGINENHGCGPER